MNLPDGAASCERCGWGGSVVQAALPNAVIALDLAIYRAGTRAALLKDLRMLRDDAITGTTTVPDVVERTQAIEQQHGFRCDLYGQVSEIGRDADT